MSRPLIFIANAALLGLGLVFALTTEAEQYDDIFATAQSFHSGDTYHGYCEFRINLENKSAKDKHTVELVYPNMAWGSGNGLNRMSRAITLAPGARAAVSMWQPPLPSYGDNALRIEVDGSRVGNLSVPNSGRHLNRSGRGYGSGGTMSSVILVGRGLDHDALTRALGGDHSGYTAAKATGAPDALIGRGFAPNAWTPDTSAGGPHWLELTYTPALVADRIRVFNTVGAPPAGDLIVVGVSGTNLLKLSLSSGVTGTSTTGPSTPIPGGRGRVRRSAGAYWEFTFPATSEAVKSVRLDFGSAPSSGISVDAVEVAGPAGSGWAADARASSDASAAPPPTPGRYAGGSPGAPASDACECLRAELPVAEWSEHWLAYSPYDGIALSVSELTSMPPGVAEAVWRYVECGGNLFVVGGGEVPEPWRSLVKMEADTDAGTSVGFGRCFIFKGEKSNLSPEAVQAVLDAANTTARYWFVLPADEQSANGAFKVVENLRIPVRGIILIMLVFVIGIGPVNLIVLSRMKRRIWMLWTIPAVSLLTCVTVFAYSLLSEGIRPDIRMEGVTLLDQVNRRATSLAAAAFYCPLTPNQGLKWSMETEATPMVEMAEYRSGTPREVDWTQTQHFRRGWVTARVPAHFQLRKSETSRERLQLEADGGHLSAVNGLGSRIQSLWLADANGKVYTATNVAAGQRAVLITATENPKVGQQLGPSPLFLKSNFGATDETLAAKPVDYLLPGTYVAELEENPFVENGLGQNVKTRHKQMRCLVYGILDLPGLAKRP